MDEDQKRMGENLEKIIRAARLLVDAELKPIDTERFQPTNFPDLGAALYKAPKREKAGSVMRDVDGNPLWEDVLLVESAQSMANRMEKVCWCDGADDRVGKYNTDCEGIPYVEAADTNGKPLTASPLEAHRLASPYIWETQPFDDPGEPGKKLELSEFLRREFGLLENRLVPWRRVAQTLFKVDPGCLLHGVWFNDADFSGGKVRITRALSGVIEARSPQQANAGFQKRDPVSDRTDKESGQTSAEGYGSVIGPKQYFTSPAVHAQFQLDIDRLRSYGFDSDQLAALVAWALYKIRKVLAGARDGVGDLRTECKFELLDEPTAWAVDRVTGARESVTLPPVCDGLRNRFSALKMLGPIPVRWVPKITGKAELPEDLNGDAINFKDFGDRVKITTETKKKRGQQVQTRYLVLSGEWPETDKTMLKGMNPGDPAKTVVEKAIEDYSKKWAAKAQGAKLKEADEGEESTES